MRFLFFLIILATVICKPDLGVSQSSQSDPPKALRPDIQVDYVMEAAPRSVRIDLDPISKDLYYNTLDGDIFRITSSGEDTLVFTSEDHGVTIMQEMLFLSLIHI